jgi:hypothetical protein
MRRQVTFRQIGIAKDLASLEKIYWLMVIYFVAIALKNMGNDMISEKVVILSESEGSTSKSRNAITEECSRRSFAFAG